MVENLALLMLLAGVLPAPVSEPYIVHWSDAHTVDTPDGDPSTREWVGTQRFDGEYATLGQARLIAREVVRKHWMQGGPVDIAHYHNDRLDTYELYYTGGGVEIRIRDGRVL